jgi:hypothetical protein
MKIPIRALAVNLLALVAACGPIVKQAPFSERPSTIKPGSYLGPFEGQVVDADTGQPLQDAITTSSWSFARGMGHQQPEASRIQEDITDPDGRYRIRALRNLPVGLSVRLSRFSFVVYKKGYVAYRHDRVFGADGLAPRSFSQFENTVRLSKWSPELSHARHLLFLGDGPGLGAASEWEVLAAVSDLDGRSARPAFTTDLAAAPLIPDRAGKRLDAKLLLSSDEIRATTGYVGAFTEAKLAGPSTDSFDSHHFRAMDKPERYDVALRVWRLSEEKLVERYEEILKALPGSKQTDEVGDRSFTVVQGEILGLGLLEKKSQVVILITCGKGQCSKDGNLLDLAKKVERNLSKLPAPTEEPSFPSEGATEGDSGGLFSKPGPSPGGFELGGPEEGSE